MDQYEQGSLPPLWSDWPYLLHLLVGDPRSQQSGIVKSGRQKFFWPCTVWINCSRTSTITVCIRGIFLQHSFPVAIPPELTITFSVSVSFKVHALRWKHSKSWLPRDKATPFGRQSLQVLEGWFWPELLLRLFWLCPIGFLSSGSLNIFSSLLKNPLGLHNELTKVLIKINVNLATLHLKSIFDIDNHWEESCNLTRKHEL
jgi:hypothetical protein